MMSTRVRLLSFPLWIMLHFGLLSFLRFPKSGQIHGLSTNVEKSYFNLVVKWEMLQCTIEHSWFGSHNCAHLYE